MFDSYHEEEVLGKPYDSRLMKRLLKYVRGYWRLVAVSILLLLVITGFDLSLPYLTKVAVDRHIVVTHRLLDFRGKDELFQEEVLKRHGENLIPVEDGLWLISGTKLTEMDRREKKRLDSEGVLKEESYYLVKDGERDLSSIFARYPDYFRRAGRDYYLSYENLGRLDRRDLLSLRGSDIRGVQRIALIFLIIICVSFCFNFGQVYLMQYVGQKVMYDLRMAIFSHLQRLSVSFFDKNPVGRLVTRVSNDVEVINEMFTGVLIYLFKDVFILMGICGVLLRLDLNLALVSFTVIPPVVYITLLFRAKARDAFRQVRLKIARINASLNENITGMRVVQIFNREQENFRRFSGINHEYYLANLREIVIFAVFRPLIEIMASVAIALLIWYGGGKVLAQTLSLGSLVAFLSYIQMFFQPIRDLSEKYNIMQAAMASSERIFLLLDNRTLIGEPEPPKELVRVTGDVEFKNVWFAYEGEEWVLKDVSFRVKPGESIAIVGATGAGKTSIINLLERFHDPNRGEVRVDGINVRELRKHALRRAIGLVMQDVFIFAGDIRSNIRLGNRSLNDHELVRVARYVNADRFIERLPNGWDEEVKERGVTLSTGERQLLSFARALAFDPRILVLDEATASVDTETESLIQEALVKLMEARTSIIIAHRLSTIQHCDRIIVMHKGRIAEEGTHPQLLSKKGLYYHLYQLQYKM